jgi:hypothetical protein
VSVRSLKPSGADLLNPCYRTARLYLGEAGAWLLPPSILF